MNQQKIGFFALAAMVIGSMVGGGAFNLPGAMAQKASAGPILIGWSITGLGMIMLALVFQHLANNKPELEGGIYAYAREGFGRFIGFNSAWGYWVSAWIGTVANITLVFNALSYFFPIFSSENRLFLLAMSVVVVWGLFFIVSSGIKEATLVNLITTIAKLVPILIFILLVAIAFNVKTFNLDFWGEGTELGSIFTQVKGTMLVTLWAFVGIEGAVVLSTRAKKRSDVGKATVMGLVGVLVIYILISVLSLGVLSQGQLAGLQEPTMAYVLEAAIGPFGATLIMIGLIISLSGALLGWTILASEISYLVAKDGAFPKFFAKTNRKGAPVGALLITQIATQLVAGIALFSAQTYLVLSSIAGICALLPYLLSAIYSVRFSKAERNKKMLIFSTIAALYSLWLVYASGIWYIVIAALVYAPGIIAYLMAEREQKRGGMSRYELIASGVLVILAAVAVYGMVAGQIQL
ncbi:arginine-ornithine antiporter [Exiguobacterium undae]|uniref:Arginine-ornithine antiporter n=2 Tax=Exiguobacterium undae TaxID=169177 RepID=A0ABX2V6M3_9BACL|nr:arginine-ornithine antiporter [Exiguobacterium undae]